MERGIFMSSKLTREEYLIKASDELRRSIFKGYKVPNFRVSTGFTGSRSGNKAIGSCWHPAAAEDRASQIFISPVISDLSLIHI